MHEPDATSRPVTERATWTDRILSAIQYPLPHHALSRLVFRLLRIRTKPVKDLQIRLIQWWFGIDLSESVLKSPRDYPHFNAFFTRPLEPDARPVVDGSGEVACPVDGAVSQAGEIDGGRIFQAKGHDFGLRELLGGSARRAKLFEDGAFATLYLSPRDYHRIHMPVTGELREMVHVPGRLFSVNPGTTRAVPHLFARNERVVAIFNTEAGPMALVLVGAIFVAAVETVWAGLVTPPRGREIRSWNYGVDEAKSVHLERGQEMGRFNMGSTVIVLFGPDAGITWADGIRPEAPVRMGELLGRLG